MRSLLHRTFDFVAAISLTGLSAAAAARGSWYFAALGMLFAWLACRRVFPTS